MTISTIEHSHKEPSNKSFRGFRIAGGGVNSAGLLQFNQQPVKYQREHTDSDVPQLEAGFPMIMLSETPETPSVFPTADASKRWSVVFSNDASISTLSFILATPNLVIPSTSP